MNVIILAAGQNKRLKEHLKEYYNDCHKCLIPINDVPLLHRMIHIFQAIEPENIVIVVGANKESIIESLHSNGFANENVKIIENSDFTKGSVLSLAQAVDYFDDEIIYIDADMYFDSGFVHKLVESPKENCILLDLNVKADDNEAYCAAYKRKELVAVGKNLNGDFDLKGEWAGITKLSKAAAQRLREILLDNIDKGNTDVFHEIFTLELSKEFPIEYELVDPYRWIEIDTKEDLLLAQTIFER